VPTITPYYDDAASVGIAGGNHLLFYLPENWDGWNSGTTEDSGLAVYPTSATGDTFGYNGDVVTLPAGLTKGSSFTPHTVWNWDQMTLEGLGITATLEGLGLGDLTTTPTVVYTAAPAAGGDTISFAVLPEPSTTALFLEAGTLSFAFIFAQRRFSKE